jgi:hypothetical protein
MGRVRQPDEARWTPDDRAVAVAWIAYRDSLCPGCGVPRDEGWHPDADGAWVGEILHCHVCAAMDRARDRHLAQEDDDTAVERAGMRAVARRREGAADG